LGDLEITIMIFILRLQKYTK